MVDNKRLLIINSVCGIGSTGRIAADIARQYEADGYEVKMAFGRGTPSEDCLTKAVRIGTRLDVLFHVLITRLFDAHGFASKRATKVFLKWAEEYNPSVLWLHNIHGYYINIEMLFEWIKSHPDMEVKWTLHDCWAFTGHCAHFSVVQCNNWIAGCDNCPQKREYPSSVFVDRSKSSYERKRKSFSNVHKLTIYTPSKWLADKVQVSFLGNYKIVVLPNEIDRGIFKPAHSSFRNDNNISDDKVVLLGVASVWTKSKGLGDLIDLYLRLDHQKYVMVIVGLDKKQLRVLPPSVIGISRVAPTKLAEIYSSSDIYINPSKEETFGLTTVEAVFCGIKAIVYQGTACEEVAKNYNGIVVEQSVDALYEAVLRNS